MAKTKLRLSQISGSLSGSSVDAFHFAEDDSAAGKYLTFNTQVGRMEFGKDLGVADSKKVMIGAAGDMSLKHDGTDSFITNATGLLRIGGSDVRIEAAAGDEIMAKFLDDGAVELNHNNVKKLETSATGATVTGVLVADGVDVGDDEIIRFGASQDLQIQHDQSDGNKDKITSAGAGGLLVTSNAMTLAAANGEEYLVAAANGSVDLYHDDVKKFETTAAGVSVTGDLQVSSHVDLPDAGFVKIGDDDDLTIKHDGTDSSLINSAGLLKLQSNGIQLKSAAGDETYLAAADDGAVELYHDNVKKVETLATGAKVTGALEITGDLVVLGDQIVANTSELMVEDRSLFLAVPGGMTPAKQAISSANPGVLTMSGHGIGNNVTTKRLLVGGGADIPDGVYTLTGIDANTLSVKTAAGANVDTTGAGATSAFVSQAAVSDSTGNNGGIYLGHVDGVASFAWDSTGEDWKSSENIDLKAAKVLKVNNVEILSATALGASVVTSGLQAVDVLGAGSIAAGFGAIDNGTSGIRTNIFTAETSILPDAKGGAVIGADEAGWGDIYIADDKKIQFGDAAGGDFKMEYDADGTGDMVLTPTTGHVLIAGDNKELRFGSGNAHGITKSGQNLFVKSGQGIKLHTGNGHAIYPNAANQTDIGKPDAEFRHVYLADAAEIKLGLDQEIQLAHVADVGLLLKETGGGQPTLQLFDAGESVSSDGAKLILTSNSVAFSMPTADASFDGQILKSNGSGVLSFVDPKITQKNSVSVTAFHNDNTNYTLPVDSGDWLRANFVAAAPSDREIYINGLLQAEGASADYNTIAGTTIQFEDDLSVGDEIVFIYRK